MGALSQWDFYGIAIAFAIHSLDPSLFSQLIVVHSLAGISMGVLSHSPSVRLIVSHSLEEISIALPIRSFDGLDLSMQTEQLGSSPGRHAPPTEEFELTPMQVVEIVTG